MFQIVILKLFYRLRVACFKELMSVILDQTLH